MAGSRRSADDGLPRCVLCKEEREGQTYTFWGAVLVTSVRAGDWVKSKYRSVRKCGAFVCRPCAERVCRRAHLPGAVGYGLGVVACAAVLITFSDQLGWAGWVFGGMTLLFALLAGLYLFRVIRPSANADAMDGLILPRVRPNLRARGKGDTFFTESERHLFDKDLPEDQTADEILEAAGMDDADDDLPRPKRKKGKRGPTKFCGFCGAELPGYATACSECKKVLA